MSYVGPTDEEAPVVQQDRGFMGFFIGTVLGLIIGAALGAYCMYVATVSMMPVAVDAVARGMAVERIEKAEPAAVPAAPPAENPAS